MSLVKADDQIMITPEQCRMARAGLAWDTAELARRAGVGAATVNRFERGAVQPTRATLTVLRQAFEAAGVEFKPDGSLRLSAGTAAAAGT